MSANQTLDAVVVGAGFAGMYMLYRLRELGFSVRVFEAGSGVGGTWYWNRYPGARCDVQSMEYSYQFSEELQQEWSWSEKFSTQPEILRYANHVADRFDLRRDIQFETRVESAHFDAENDTWKIETDRGDSLRARYCVMATGCLSSHNVPDFPGLSDFEGEVLHTGTWPHEPVDFSGKRVGIIGTGSSGIQSIPVVAEQAEHLTVFQRTANFSIPAHNGPLDREYEAAIKGQYSQFRAQNALMPAGLQTQPNEDCALSVSAEERQAVYEDRWQRGGLPFVVAFADLGLNPEANETAADFIRAQIRASVSDPEVAELLCPRTVVGCKRICVDTNYFATYNRDNVTLVDVSDGGIESITPEGVRADGRDFEFDMIILATGFDAMTGALARIDIRGREGLQLTEKWSEGPKTYLGLGVSGFPNFFTITGPGSPSVLSNMLPSIEQHVNWIAECVSALSEQGVATIEASAEAEEAWVAHVNEVAGMTLYTRCNSWYLGANVPGKPRVFMPYIGFPPYVEKCNAVAANGYEGFVLDSSA